MEYILDDELSVYRGKDISVAEGIVIHQPTLDEICIYGEQEYFSIVHTFTATPADMKWQLDDLGIDYTTISDFELFYGLIYKGLDSESTRIIFGDLDWRNFKLIVKENSCELYDEERNLYVDENTYNKIADILRKIHGRKKNDELPGNESTKRILIEDAREEYLRNKNKEFHSQLKNLISAMINSEGFKYNHSEVWNMKINAFMDSVQRITKIKNADLLFQSGYSGFGINLKDIDNKKLDWLGEL